MQKIVGARLADRAVCIGPARANDSYLRIGTLIEAARVERGAADPVRVDAAALGGDVQRPLDAADRDRAAAGSAAGRASAILRSVRWPLAVARPVAISPPGRQRLASLGCVQAPRSVVLGA